MPNAVWLTIFWAACLFASDGNARNISLDHYLDWETASDPQISPDGSLILYQRQSVDKVQDNIRSEIWAIEVDSRRQFRLLESAHTIRWSPSGDRIAFLGRDNQVYVRRMDESGATSRITTNIKRIQRLEWGAKRRFSSASGGNE